MKRLQRVGRINYFKIMYGKRALPSEARDLKVKCRRLRKQGLSFNAIGFRLGLHHTTVMWHLGRIKKNPKTFGKLYMRKRRKLIKEGKVKVIHRGKWITQERETALIVDGRLIKEKVLVATLKDRVKGLDGKYYYWCPDCLFKMPWDEFKKTGECAYCAKKEKCN